tara:strand:- start:29 stop:295 length:267 start_codon:yes stop_codon:yes gene_type:complete
MITEYHANGHAPGTILSQAVFHLAVVFEEDLAKCQVLQMQEWWGCHASDRVLVTILYQVVLHQGAARLIRHSPGGLQRLVLKYSLLLC